MDTTAFKRSFRPNKTSLMACDSASEKANGPEKVSLHSSVELPMPPKFASKLRLESTPIKYKLNYMLEMIELFSFIYSRTNAN